MHIAHLGEGSAPDPFSDLNVFSMAYFFLCTYSIVISDIFSLNVVGVDADSDYKGPSKISGARVGFRTNSLYFLSYPFSIGCLFLKRYSIIIIYT